MGLNDTTRLEWLLALISSQSDEAADALWGAIKCGLKGRVALDAAIQAVYLEPGDELPPLTAIDRVIIELERRKGDEPGLTGAIPQGLYLMSAADAVIDLENAMAQASSRE